MASVGPKWSMAIGIATNVARRCAATARLCRENDCAFVRFVGAAAGEGWNLSCGGWIGSIGNGGEEHVRCGGNGQSPRPQRFKLPIPITTNCVEKQLDEEPSVEEGLSSCMTHAHQANTAPPTGADRPQALPRNAHQEDLHLLREAWWLAAEAGRP